MPDRMDPNERDRRMPEPEIGGGLETNRPSAWIGWLWVWLLVIVVAAFWFAGWGWGGHGGWWWGKKPAVAMVNPNIQLSGSGIAIMDAPDKQVYVGQPFELNNVPVQKKVSNTAIWVGTRSSGPMLVVFGGNASSNNENGTSAETGKNNARKGGPNNNTSQNSANGENANAPGAAGATITAPNLEEGDALDLSGTVEKAPPANEAKQQWGLSDSGVQRLEHQGAYIRVAQVSKVEQRAQR